MKVLVARFAQEYGGAERSFVNHLSGLKQLGHQVVGLTNVPAAQKQLRAARIPYRNLWWFKLRLPLPIKVLLVAPWQLLQLLLIVRRERPDVINAHSYFDQITLSLLRPLHRRPIVWKDPADLKLLLRGSGRLRRWLFFKAIAQADYIYTVSRDDQRQINALLPAKIDKSRVVVIPSGIDFGNYNLKAAAKAAKGKWIIGFIGRLDKIKGADYLLRAAPAIIRSLPNAQFWLVGEGREADNLRALATELGISDQVKFWGNQTNISPWLKSFAVLVIPSVSEGWGLSAHEGRLFGKAIVASQVGGLPEQIQDGQNGLLVPPRQPQAIARAVIKIAKSPRLRQDLQTKARLSAKQDGDFSGILRQQIVPLFERALSRGRR